MKNLTIHQRLTIVLLMAIFSLLLIFGSIAQTTTIINTTPNFRVIDIDKPEKQENNITIINQNSNSVLNNQQRSTLSTIHLNQNTPIRRDSSTTIQLTQPLFRVIDNE